MTFIRNLQILRAFSTLTAPAMFRQPSLVWMQKQKQAAQHTVMLGIWSCHKLKEELDRRIPFSRNLYCWKASMLSKQRRVQNSRTLLRSNCRVRYYLCNKTKVLNSKTTAGKWFITWMKSNNKDLWNSSYRKCDSSAYTSYSKDRRIEWLFHIAVDYSQVMKRKENTD